MPIFWLSENDLSFPDPEQANPDGILAVGGDLSVERLLVAYRKGLFPWFNPEDPILWWSPDPRFVLYPKNLKVSKSMRPYFNQKKFTITFDQNFEDVIRNCQKTYRKGQVGGTWITEEMIESYTALHHAGYAHSVEVWKKDELVGGLYGISLGKVFFGESMFATESNASKMGFITLVRILEQKGFELVDCQQRTQHLESLGGTYVSRKQFLKIMEDNTKNETLLGNWSSLNSELSEEQK